MLSLFRLSPPAPRKPSGLQRDTVAFVLSDGRRIDVLRVRDPRAKRLRLSVGERGARLTLPMRASLVSGERFLHEHRDWLTEQLMQLPGDALPLVRGETATLPLRGGRVALHWEDGRVARVVREGDAATMQLPARAGSAAISRALRDFYEAEARADIGGWLPAYLPGLPRPPARIRLRVLSSQWGSLAPDGTLTLDLALVLGRPSAFRYVLVHELCHLVHADHSRAFWREVEARCPDWREERTYFHAEGRRLKAALHTLLG
ncbi:M48 family metallopeptidase [Luteimonas viscosa]|uniref:M48 family metallopeptidase n=1 Tax=Luteimonas viscosa TaxID=1132694 RepID=A0A5D4XQJ0_9GAMM|nr:SprT family zinc-dependent metalloprotease [Luteimonas viscosa]TYT26225.1 M48 family metallopeptidase [Luteimonas viscosa]